MSSPILTADFADVEYPESDGLPMADNTEQAFWMTFLFGGFSAMFRKHADVFVAMNLFWYPVKGAPKIRTAPDVMIALGRPKGRRGSYKQWVEDDIAPQVVIEVLSPGNTLGELRDKLGFYERHGAQEYYIFDPDERELTVYLRREECMVKQHFGEIWLSPLLGVQFDVRDHDLRVVGTDGKPFQSIEELTEVNAELVAEVTEMLAARDAASAQLDAAATEHARIIAERDRLLAQLQAAGIEPKP